MQKTNVRNPTFIDVIFPFTSTSRAGCLASSRTSKAARSTSTSRAARSTSTSRAARFTSTSRAARSTSTSRAARFTSTGKSARFTKILLKKIALVLSFSLLTAVCAKIRVYLPFTPVPITGQTMAVLLTGTILGSQMGALSILAYLLLGIAGIPLFSGKIAGIAYLLGPTGGYLIGFLVAAFVMGKLAEKGTDRSIISCIPMMLLGELIIYAFGLAWLARFVPLNKLLMTGLVPFIPGDLIKLGLASVIMLFGWRIYSIWDLKD